MSTEKYVFDKIGNVINVDDWVVYGRSQGDNIHFGTVTEVLPAHDGIKVRNQDTGRVSVNARFGKEVLVVTFLKEMFPEFFI